jgi:hypothetical protein
VAVIPAGSGRIRREDVPPTPSPWRHRWRPFLSRAVNVGRNVEAVPVDELFVARVIPNIDDQLSPLSDA